MKPDLDMPGTCAVATTDWYTQAAESCSWDVAHAFLFLDIKTTDQIADARTAEAMAPETMTARLRRHAEWVGSADIFSLCIPFG